MRHTDKVIKACFSLIENNLIVLLPPILNWAYNLTSQKKNIIVVKLNVKFFS